MPIRSPLSRSRPGKYRASDDELPVGVAAWMDLKYGTPLARQSPVNGESVENGDPPQQNERVESGVGVGRGLTEGAIPNALPELLHAHSYEDRPTQCNPYEERCSQDRQTKDVDCESPGAVPWCITLEAIAKLRREHVDYFDVEDLVKQAITYGTNRDVLMLLDFAFVKLIMYDEDATEVEKSRWAIRMMDVYTATADSIMTEPNVEVRESLVAGPLTSHVYSLAHDTRLLTKLINRRLPDQLIEKFVATRIFRSVLQVKYNSPACWLTFAWSFSWFCVSVAAYSSVAYQLGPGYSHKSLSPDGAQGRAILAVMVSYIGMSGFGGIMVECFRICRIRSHAFAGAYANSPKSMFGNALRLLRALRCDLWHWVDLSASVMLFGVATWTAAIWMRSGSPPSLHSGIDDVDDAHSYSTYNASFSNFVAFGTLILWIKVLAFLKGIGLKYAAFVQMLIKIVKDLKQFVVVLAVIFIAFTQVFYIRLGPMKPKFVDDETLNPFRTFPQTLHAMYLLAFIGEFDPDDYPRPFDKCFLFLFIFVIIVVMLNVLIAIVCDSYNYAMATSVQLFWRSRLELMFEYENKESFDSLLCRVLQPFHVSMESTLSVLKAEMLDEEGDGGPRSDMKVGRVLDIVTRVDKHVNVEFARLKRAMFVELQEINLKLNAMCSHPGSRSAFAANFRGGKPTKWGARPPTGMSRKTPSGNMFSGFMDPRVARGALFGNCFAGPKKRKDGNSPVVCCPLQRQPPARDIVEQRLTRVNIVSHQNRRSPSELREGPLTVTAHGRRHTFA